MVDNSQMMAERQALAELWWMPLVRGVLLVFVGILMLAEPGGTLEGILIFLGIYLIVDGLFGFVEGIRGTGEHSRLWTFVGSIVSVAIGVVVIGHPILSGAIGVTFLIYLLGIALIIKGCSVLIAGQHTETEEHHRSFWTFLLGILYILFGIFVVAHPLFSLGAMLWLFVAWAFITGVSAVVLAFHIRGLKNV